MIFNVALIHTIKKYWVIYIEKNIEDILKHQNNDFGIRSLTSNARRL